MSHDFKHGLVAQLRIGVLVYVDSSGDDVAILSALEKSKHEQSAAGKKALVTNFEVLAGPFHVALLTSKFARWVYACRKTAGCPWPSSIAVFKSLRASSSSLRIRSICALSFVSGA